MAAADARWVRAPLGQGRLLLPRRSRRDALAGLTLLNPNRPVARLAARAYGSWLALGGPRLSGRSVHELPEVMSSILADLGAAVSEVAGPVTGWALIDPRQADRPRVAALALHEGRAVAFVKLNRSTAELDRERRALEALEHVGTVVRVPRVLGAGELGGIAWMATTAMPSPWTRPVTTLPTGWRVGAELGAPAALAELLGRPEVPGQVAMHGDLTPWNLRRCAGEVWLLDWEDLRWGPAGADEAYFHATATAVCGAPLVPTDAELTAYWIGIVSARRAQGAEVAFRSALISTLRRMAEAPVSAR